MKTAILPGVRPVAGLVRMARHCAVVTGALTLLAGNLPATTVTWISGGPNPAEGVPSGAGYVDGDITTDAEYNTPRGLAIDETGNYLFVADQNNNTVRVLEFDINTTGTLLTYTNYVQDNNIFSQPVGVALDSADNLFVLNRAQNTNGTVLEFDNTSELIATNLANITNAGGIALDPSDNIYVTASNQVLKVTYPSTVSILATITATNCYLQGITYKHNGKLAVCDTGRNGILLIDPNTGIVTTNAGFHGQGDFVTVNNTSISNTATFFQPSGIAESGDGTLIVSDYGNNRVKAVLPNGSVTNIYGVTSNDWVSPYPGFSPGTVALPDKPGGVAARSPYGIVVAPNGSLYTTEDYYHIIEQVSGADFIAQPPQPPGAPQNLTATVFTNQNAVEVVLNWSGVNTATNYLVERSTSTNSFAFLASVGLTNSYIDANVNQGTTYYYEIIAENGGGESAPSGIATVTIPIPPPPPPTIGWFDYEGINAFSVFHPLAALTVANNDMEFAIMPNITGVPTYFIAGPTPVTGTPTTNSSVAYVYQNGAFFGTQTPLPIATVPDLTIVAENINGLGEGSPAVSVRVLFQAGTPIVQGTNAAQFLVADVTTNVTYLYTTDGSNPLTNAAPQSLTDTNGAPLTFSINNNSTFTFEIAAVRAGYANSAVVTNVFLSQNFSGNELTWGFQSGYCSSKYIASPGEIFYAPVTLTSLPGTALYGFDFDMVVTNLGAHPVPLGDYYFESMLREPGTESNLDIPVLVPIPPYMFIGEASSPPPPSQIEQFNGTNFENLETYETNINELAVGWFEQFGRTNLFNTTAQNLLSLSQAFIEVIPDGNNPLKDIIGGYAFQVPTNAVPGEQYQIQMNRASGNGDGFGLNGSDVGIDLPVNGSLTNGSINAIKLVTVGQPKYMAGDVYPFGWFNAGDFGHGDLTNYSANDIIEVFNAAIYQINPPPAGSDFADAMDSSGGLGVYDTAAGYWTNSGTLSGSALNVLFSLNDTTTINEMAFGDGHLDVSDVYVTFLRSQFAGLYWFERFYTNDPVHGVFGRVAQAIYPQTNIDGFATSILPEDGNSGGKQFVAPVSITNTPTVHFAAGDALASAGQTVSIPITASVFGTNPVRMLMFNAAVVPLDGSPAPTSPVTFSPNAPFNNTAYYYEVGTNSPAYTAAAFLPESFPISANEQITGSNVIGYLSFTVPSSATSMSAYQVYFNHASASPNGLVSFPNTACPGLVTLSSRTSSSYNDGIPDSWRLRYFGTIYNQLSVSNADADGTPMNNWQKYQAGLNPVDPTSILNEGMDQNMANNSQDFVLYWPTVAGQKYIVEKSIAIAPPQWTAISTNIGTGTFMEIHDNAGSTVGIYKVIATQ
jgi:hypothetical protein